jgi:thiopurine S-methyltransferase
MKLPEKKMGELDLIYDKASIVALPEKMRESYAKKLSALSSGNTKILMHLLSYDPSEMTGPPFSVDPNEVKRLFSDNFDIQLLEKNSLDIHKFEKFLNRGLKSDLIEYLLLLS